MTPRSTYYFQECPTCGRTLQIRVAYLGRSVVCQHCLGKFVAADPEVSAYPEMGSSSGILQRANELLDAMEHRRLHPR